jgi:hypothetical protein
VILISKISQLVDITADTPEITQQKSLHLQTKKVGSLLARFIAKRRQLHSSQAPQNRAQELMNYYFDSNYLVAPSIIN